MKIVQINSTCGSGSTGKICVAVSELLTAKDVENFVFYAVGNSTYPLGKRYMSAWDIKWQTLKSRVFGTYGFQTKNATKRLLKELEQISPDIVHLHNLHSHNVHLGMLFSWLKEKKIKVFWTFHDCWAFTGYCPHYDMIGCEKWKNDGCHKCPQKNRFSWFFDQSFYLFEQKKRLFSELDLTIITPSHWLAGQVKQSFLKKCDIKVIHNGIDLSIFYPRKSNFREKYQLRDKYVVLGVAFDWGVRKGLDVFIKLAKMLDNRFQIVLVGTNDKVDQQLPPNIISIHRTQNQAELAEIYTAADIFVNPTREENFPTVHMEALACGTPILTFDTGGCKEVLVKKCGMVVPRDDIQSLYNGIVAAYTESPFSRQRCVERAAEYNERDKFKEYIGLYVR